MAIFISTTKTKHYMNWIGATAIVILAIYVISALGHFRAQSLIWPYLYQRVKPKEKWAVFLKCWYNPDTLIRTLYYTEGPHAAVFLYVYRGFPMLIYFLFNEAISGLQNMLRSILYKEPDQFKKSEDYYMEKFHFMRDKYDALREEAIKSKQPVSVMAKINNQQLEEMRALRNDPFVREEIVREHEEILRYSPNPWGVLVYSFFSKEHFELATKADSK